MRPASWPSCSGPTVVKRDRRTRVHRFRDRCRPRSGDGPRRGACADRRLRRGVEAGLRLARRQAVRVPPARREPAPWKPEDSVLVRLRCSSTCREHGFATNRPSASPRDTLPEPLFDFLAPPGTEWDAPLRRAAVHHAAYPRPGRLRPAPRPRPRPVGRRPTAPPARCDRTRRSTRQQQLGRRRRPTRPTATPCVANDMHLGIRVPGHLVPRLAGLARDRTASERQRLTGVTLPGDPGLVAGSNGHVAWGFTNSEGDWSDLVDARDRPRATRRLPHARRRRAVRDRARKRSRSRADRT